MEKCHKEEAGGGVGTDTHATYGVEIGGGGCGIDFGYVIFMRSGGTKQRELTVRNLSAQHMSSAG